MPNIGGLQGVGRGSGARYRRAIAQPSYRVASWQIAPGAVGGGQRCAFHELTSCNRRAQVDWSRGGRVDRRWHRVAQALPDIRCQRDRVHAVELRTPSAEAASRYLAHVRLDAVLVRPRPQVSQLQRRAVGIAVDRAISAVALEDGRAEVCAAVPCASQEGAGLDAGRVLDGGTDGVGCQNVGWIRVVAPIDALRPSAVDAHVVEGNRGVECARARASHDHIPADQVGSGELGREAESVAGCHQRKQVGCGDVRSLTREVEASAGRADGCAVLDRPGRIDCCSNVGLDVPGRIRCIQADATAPCVVAPHIQAAGVRCAGEVAVAGVGASQDAVNDHDVEQFDIVRVVAGDADIGVRTSRACRGSAAITAHDNAAPGVAVPTVVHGDAALASRPDPAVLDQVVGVAVVVVVRADAKRAVHRATLEHVEAGVVELAATFEPQAIEVDVAVLAGAATHEERSIDDGSASVARNDLRLSRPARAVRYQVG